MKKKEIILPKNDGLEIIVSITSFPQRIPKIWLVIECILKQKSLPNKIILWLSKGQFPNEMEDLPRSLTKYVESNVLEIVFLDEDIRSHKKYYYAFQKFPKDVIITLDDDIYYPSNIISDLLKTHKKHPNTICCHRAHTVTKNKNNKLESYTLWEKNYGKFGPSFKIFHTSGGGTLYKKEMFNEEVLNKEVFKKLSFYADDVWLNIMAQLSGTKTIKTNYFSNLIPIYDKKAIFKLSVENLGKNGNDIQLKNLIKYYEINEDKVFE
ncbi:glycosyltransferase [Myroides guanonis]|nr:glycosyltransferase [Myroides guanonis]